MAHRPLELTKSLQKEIADLAQRAHERALSAELAQLEDQFRRWRNGELDAFELSAAIHRFHEGPPRRLWLAFNTNQKAVLGALVEQSLADGLLKIEELTDEARAYFRK